MIALVCGSRLGVDRKYLFKALYRYDVMLGPITVVIHGGQTGVDRQAADWANHRGIFQREFRANWTKWRGHAGPMRNREMLKVVPDFVIAFPGDRGTANMIEQAERHGFTVYRVPPPLQHMSVVA